MRNEVCLEVGSVACKFIGLLPCLFTSICVGLINAMGLRLETEIFWCARCNSVHNDELAVFRPNISISHNKYWTQHLLVDAHAVVLWTRKRNYKTVYSVTPEEMHDLISTRACAYTPEATGQTFLFSILFLPFSPIPPCLTDRHTNRIITIGGRTTDGEGDVGERVVIQQRESI